MVIQAALAPLLAMLAALLAALAPLVAMLAALPGNLMRLQTWKTLRAARWMRRRRERSPAAVCSSRDHLQLLAG